MSQSYLFQTGQIFAAHKLSFGQHMYGEPLQLQFL